MAKFPVIPITVVEYIRGIFASANNEVSLAVTAHPSMHEEALDHILVMKLTAAPAAFFANEQVAISIESHWLGMRWMSGRWEIADIGFFILIRKNGHLLVRKVALLQTKRLYSKEIPVAELGPDDYEIGIGRLVDRTDPQMPLSKQRAFNFDLTCKYDALKGGRSSQVQRIARYVATQGIPVHFGLYNPIRLPYQALYPSLDGVISPDENAVGCRIVTRAQIESVLKPLRKTQSPTAGSLLGSPPTGGWRLEDFIADEVLRCREGKIFEDTQDQNLRSLLYVRSAPMTAAIVITIDFGPERQS